jgi:hypothetical protein
MSGRRLLSRIFSASPENSAPSAINGTGAHAQTLAIDGIVACSLHSRKY